MRIGIISDIHEDYKSLKNALSLLEKMNVDEIVCLGDIVGFNTKSFNYLERRNPANCIAAIRENCSIVVTGNHDLYAVRKTPVHNAGFNFTNNWYSLEYEERKQRGENHVWLYEDLELSAMLNKKDRIYLASLPEVATMKTENHNLLFTHYLYPDVTGSQVLFTHNVEKAGLHLEYMQANKYSLGFSGHGHIEGVICIGEKEIVGSGFSSFKINEFPRAFVGPAIAEGKKKNGFSVLNTDEMVLDCISL